MGSSHEQGMTKQRCHSSVEVCWQAFVNPVVPAFAGGEIEAGPPLHSTRQPLGLGAPDLAPNPTR